MVVSAEMVPLLVVTGTVTVGTAEMVSLVGPTGALVVVSAEMVPLLDSTVMGVLVASTGVVPLVGSASSVLSVKSMSPKSSSPSPDATVEFCLLASL